MRKCLVAAGAALAVLSGIAGRPAGRPNVVIFLADDLGYGDTGCYGATALKTPHIDSLARNGRQFMQGYAASATCTPSRYALLTGIYPVRRKVTGALRGNDNLIIEPGSLTLAQLFRNAGYRTGVVGKWNLGLGRGRIDWNGEIRPSPLEVGFTYSFITPATLCQPPTVYLENRRVVGLDPADPLEVNDRRPFPGEPTGLTDPGLMTKLKLNPSYSPGHTGSIVNGIGRWGFQKGGKSAWWVDEEMAGRLSERALHFIGESVAAGAPFFLYYPLHQPHSPRVPGPAFAGKTPLGPRGDVIAEADWQVGELLKCLGRLGIEKDTIVIFTSDNGPVVGDSYADRAEELNRKAGHRPSGRLRGGKWSRYEGGTHMPMLLQWKGTVAPGKSDAVVCQIDFLASFAAMLGQTVPERISGMHVDSENVLDAFLGRSEKGRDALVLESLRRLSLRAGNDFLVPFSARPGAKGKKKGKKAELYDLAADPSQKRDIAAEHPERVDSLLRLLREILSR